MSEFSLLWQLGNTGSAKFTLRFPREDVEIHTTYVGDGLRSVVKAAGDLQLGSSSAIAFLPAEPGGTCLFFGGADEDVYMQIVHFEDMESESGRWRGGNLRWHGRVNVSEFIRSVVIMADEFLAQCGGSDAYSTVWGGISFPLEELEYLRPGS